MKHLNIVQLLFRFRSFAQDVLDKVVSTNVAVNDMKTLLSNHVIHRLDDHDERLKNVDGKLDIIIEKLDT